MKRLLSLAASAGTLLVASQASAAWLDGLTPVSGEVVIRGTVRTTIDGSTFDAVTQKDMYPQIGADPAPRMGGLFDLEAGGLRVVEQNGSTYRVAPTGSVGPSCRAAGLASPCLVPRIKELAHERLVTESELSASLLGDIAVEPQVLPPPPPPPVVEPQTAKILGGVLAFLAAIAAAAIALAVRRARRVTRIGQVYVAAAEARRATRGDVTLKAAREHIDALVARAETLEKARIAAARRLAKIDRKKLDAKRDAWARSPDPDAAQALAALTAECQEAERLASDLTSSLAGLERIASSLRTVALRAREHRGTRARIATHDPVDAMTSELDLRDDAMAEVERVS
jgi:hypothetical protein